MLGIGTLGMYLSAPGQSFSVAVFIDPMLGDLGLRRTDYSFAYLIAGLVGGALLPGIGWLLDRLGARVLLPTLGLLLGTACVWMSSIGSLLGLSIGFTMIRSIGQGAVTLSSTWLVGEWFQRRRGVAMGVVGLGGAVSVMTIPMLNNFLIEEFGWRSAWSYLAVMVWGGLVIPALLLIRDRPEPLGLLPDGRWQDDDVSDVQASELQDAGDSEAGDLTVGETLRLASFWKLLAVLCVTSMVGTGLIFHQVSLLAVHGIARTDALLLLGLQAGVATVTGVLAGWLTDMGYERYLLAVSMLFLASGVGLMLGMPSPGWALVYGSLLGLQGGIIRTAGTAVWINYYGRANQGAIRGVAMAAAVVAAACGPLPLAVSWDWTGSYKTALIIFAVLPIVAGAGVVTARRPASSQP